MTCPRCSGPLSAEPHETGVAWRCGKCAGQSLNFSQFRKMIPRLQANEIWLTVMENPVPPRWLGRCPECRNTMSAVLVPFPSGDAELDVCLPCQRLWMDRRTHGTPLLENGTPCPSPAAAALPVVRMEGRKHERRASRGAAWEEAPMPPSILARIGHALSRRWKRR